MPDGRALAATEGCLTSFSPGDILARGLSLACWIGWVPAAGSPKEAFPTDCVCCSPAWIWPCRMEARNKGSGMTWLIFPCHPLQVKAFLILLSN